MDLEKEYRFNVDDKTINKIHKVAEVIEPKQIQTDLTLGYDGFDSLSKHGYICRVRKKANKISMEVKSKKDSDIFVESKVPLSNFKDGVDIFLAIGMKPYLYINRTREILKYKGLKIFIDKIDMLGNYVEIEVQNSKNPEEEFKEFISIVGITGECQPLYGDIFKSKLKNREFAESFKRKMQEGLKEIK